MIKYYLHDGIQEQGPFDFEQLKSKNVTKDTKVWHEGLDNWTTIGEISELKDLLIRKTPPPMNITIEEVKPPKLKEEMESNSYKLSETKVKKMRSKLYLFIIICILIISSIVGWLIYQNVENGETIESLSEQISSQYETLSTQESVLTEQSNADQERKRINSANTAKNMKYRNNWYNYINASSNSYSYSEIGGISDLEVIITNQTEYMLDEVEVLVSYVKTNGYNFKTETVTVYNIPANGTKSATAPESNRGTSVNLDIQGIISKKMHFCYSAGNWSNNSDDPYFCK
jgi:hypothetical protein